MSSTESLVAESSPVVAGEPEARRRIPWIRIIYVAAIAGTLAYHSLTVEGFATVQNVTNVLNQIRIFGNARV